MPKKINFVFLFSLFLISTLLVGCSNEHNSFLSNQQELIRIAPKTLTSDRVVNQELSNLSFIPLMSDKQAYLGEIKKLLKHEDYLVILCHGRSAIYVFDHAGIFQFMIKPRGRGPLEFVSLQDVELWGDHLFISDNELGKILKYDLEQQAFMEEWRVEVAPFAMAKSEDYLYIMTNDFTGGIIKSAKDLAFSSLESSVNAQTPFNLINSPQPFLSDGEGLFLSASFSDTIYRARKGKFYPYATIGDLASSMADLSPDVIVDAFFNRKSEARKQIEGKLIPAGYISAVDQKWIIRLQNPFGFCIVWDRETEQSFLIKEDPFFDRISLLTGVPYPSFKYQDAEGYVYMGFLPTRNWYESITRLPADDPIRRAAEDGLGNYFGDPAFENPVLVKFRPGEQFLEVE